MPYHNQSLEIFPQDPGETRPNFFRELKIAISELRAARKARGQEPPIDPGQNQHPEIVDDRHEFPLPDGLDQHQEPKV